MTDFDPRAGIVFELGGVLFGGRGNNGLIVTEFDPAGWGVRATTTDRPHGHGLMVGRDYLGGASWTFTIVTHGDTAADAYALAQPLARAWRPDLGPGELVALRLWRAGKWLRVMGRPRQYAGPSGDVMTSAGAGTITASFEVTDPRVYDDAERSVVVGTVPNVGATGLVFPVRFPVVWDVGGQAGTRSGVVDMHGTVPAPVTVTFRGPMSHPRLVHSSGWEVGITGTLAYDEQVILDGRTRTARATVGGAPAGNPASRLTRHTRLDRLTVDPGRSEFTLDAVDATGTGSALITWRDAHESI